MSSGSWVKSIDRSKREPRRRASAAVYDCESTNTDLYTTGFWEQGIASGWELDKKRRRERSIRIRVIPMILPLVIFAVALSGINFWIIRNRQARDSKQGILFQTSKVIHSGTVGILLHPENHVNRGSRILQHDWVVTSGIRSPDGVQKQVYLINSEPS